MKNKKDVLVFIQARLGSQRVKNKMLRPFCGSNLFEISVNKVLESDIPKENFYASIYEKELKEIANKYDVNIFNRSYESAINDNSLQKIYEWHDKLPFKYAIMINGCCPMLKVETINKFYKHYLESPHDGLFAVVKKKNYFWNEEGELVTPWPKNQTIMNTKAVSPTFEAAMVFFAGRTDTIRDDIWMGSLRKKNDPELFVMEEEEMFDIDYEWQFQAAEKLYEVKTNKLLQSDVGK